MKKLVSMVAAIALLFSTAVAETVTVLCKPGDVVNIRERPTTKSDVVGRYECGYTFETDGVVKKDNQGRRWVHMVNASLEVDEAWVIESYVQYSKVDIASTTATVEARGRVALRKSPGGDRIKWLKNGEQVNVLATSDEWAVTDRGYVAIECLLFDGGEG